MKITTQFSKIRILAFASCVILAQPALADCVIQFAGQSKCTGYNSLASLTPGVEIPSDATWLPWIKYKEDVEVVHYSIANGVLSYLPPDGSASFVVPDSDGAKFAIMADPTVAPIIGNLFQLIPIIDSYEKNSALAKQGWAVAKQQFSATWLTSDIITAIEQHCADHGCPMN